MKKTRFTGRMLAVMLSACLCAECLAYMNPAEVQAGDVQDAQTEGTQADDGTADSEGKESVDETSGGTGGSDGSGNSSGAAGNDADEKTGSGVSGEEGAYSKENSENAGNGKTGREGDRADAEGISGGAGTGMEEQPMAASVGLQEAKSFADEYAFLAEFKKISSKVSEDPHDGRFYYSGSNIKPEIEGVYSLKEITEDDAKKLEADTETKNQVYRTVDKDKKPRFFQKETRLAANTDYTVKYPSSCKLPGTYELKVCAVSGSGKYTGEMAVTYEIVEKSHKWGSWSTVSAATVFKAGSKKRTCSVCKTTETAAISKLKATAKVNMTTIKLKRKQSTTKFKVSGLAKGDSVKSYKSSNKKLFTVDKKGKIKAKNKSGTAKLTVTLKSGKKVTAKVKVQKGTVKTTKVTVNTSKLTLLKGGKYTLKTSMAPLTTQQKMKFSSSNKKVASVSSKGVITAKKKGTAKITVKSGGKKKTVTVSVQTKTFAKGDTNGFLNSCKKIANIIMTDGNWIYYSGPGMKKSLAEARDHNPRQTSCANFVNLCMQDFGTLEPGMAFYSNGKGQLIYQGSSSLKARTKAMVEKNYDIINLGGVKAVKAGLQPGDICLYKGHTNVFAGLDSKGVPTWYDGGRNATSDGKPESGYFTHMFRTSNLNSLPVYIVLRLKKK